MQIFEDLKYGTVVEVIKYNKVDYVGRVTRISKTGKYLDVSFITEPNYWNYYYHLVNYPEEEFVPLRRIKVRCAKMNLDECQDCNEKFMCWTTIT